ncbi:MAG: hypothetical protein V4574_00070 [Pseudomonadota bacterium]
MVPMMPSHAEASLDQRLAAMLEENEYVPQSVIETVEYCSAKNLWFLIGRNSAVRSCREAAARRVRLGKCGIPLRDELRSYLAEGIDGTGNKRTILFHCRGDQSLSIARLNELDLGLSGLTRAVIADLADEHLGYGLVNPFLSPARQAALGLVRQVFDRSLLDDEGEAGTMMTNAGSLTWSIEFQPAALVRALGPEAALVATIAAETELASTSLASRTIGLVTGNGPESGALLWKRINEEVRRRGGASFAGDISYPRVLISSLPAMGWSMELSVRSELLWDKVRDELLRLTDDGADVIALACNTTQFYQDRIDSLLQNRGSTFVRLSSAVKNWIDSRASPIYVVGIGDVVNNTTQSAFAFLHEYRNCYLPTLDRSKHMESLAYLVKQKGANSLGLQNFRRIMRTSPCNDVLLLLTECSIILDKYRGRVEIGRNVVDSMDLYASAIVNSISWSGFDPTLGSSVTAPSSQSCTAS